MEYTLYYESPNNVYECIIQITKEPHQYDCKWGTALWYKTNRISDTQVLITFTGGQFRKMMQTQYLMEFLPQEHHTLIGEYIEHLVGHGMNGQLILTRGDVG